MSRKNSYLWKLAKRAKMEYATKATTVGMLAEWAKMEYTARAGAADSGDDGGFAGSAGGSQSGAMTGLLLPMLLPMIAEHQHNAATAMGQSDGMRVDHCPTIQTTIALAPPRSGCS